MSYTRSIVRRQLAGTTSQPPRPPVSRFALGDTVKLREYPDPAPIYSRGKISTWVRVMQSVGGTSLGDDTLDATAKWQQDMLASNNAILEAHKHWADGDRMQKWIAIGVTASIPVFAAIWRALGIGRRRRRL